MERTQGNFLPLKIFLIPEKFFMKFFFGIIITWSFFCWARKKKHICRQIENRDPTLFIMYITDINTMFWIVEVDYDVDQNQEWK